MKSLVFDTGSIISLAINDLLWILEPLKQRFKGEFLISNGIKKELIDKPLTTKRFKFEAIKVLHYIENRTIKTIEDDSVRKKAFHLLELANNSFIAQSQPINIVHYGEISGIAAAIQQNSEAFVVDERTTRLLIENPNRIRKILRYTLHTDVKVNHGKLKEFRKEANLKVIRSVDLATVAYEMGLLDSYLTNIPDARENLLDSVLWGLKLNGCAISKKEINQILKLEIKR